MTWDLDMDGGYENGRSNQPKRSGRKMMTGPEVMRAFRVWQGANRGEHRLTRDVYPLNVGVSGQLGGRWYVRERLPGTRVWRAEEDGSFTLLEHTQPRPLGEAFRLAAMDGK